MNKKIIIAGGAGYIGGLLAERLKKEGFEVKVIDIRKSLIADSFIHDLTEEIPAYLLEGVYAVINLSGRNIFARWTNSVKEEIYKSRVLSTRNLVQAMAKTKERPEVFISGSAVGFYGDRGEEELNEYSKEGDQKKDHLVKVCVDWEKEALKAEELGIRTIVVRTAPVLGEGGLMQKIVPFFRFGLGGPIGKGDQWFPWVYEKDLISIYSFLLFQGYFSGPVIAAAPDIVRHKEFAVMLGRTFHRPAILPMPKSILKVFFGDLADNLVSSQKVFPKKLMESHFEFSYPKLEDVFADMF